MTITITEFMWAGRKGPFKIKSHCEECDITKNTLEDMKKKEFRDKKIKLEYKPWLDNIFYSLMRRGWHPPIIMVNGKKFHQFKESDPIFNRKKLVKYVDELLKK